MLCIFGMQGVEYCQLPFEAGGDGHRTGVDAVLKC